MMLTTTIISMNVNPALYLLRFMMLSFATLADR
jgi:hypothetical protein